MALFLLKRSGLAALVLLLVFVLLVLVVRIVPGDPARAIAQATSGGPLPSPAYISSVRHELALDQSAPRQLWLFVSRAVQGDFGTDLVSQTPVSSELTAVLGNTILLALAAVLISVVVGIPLGVAAARSPNGLLDRLIGGVSIGLITLSPYVTGLFLILIFGVRVHWFPAIGAGHLSHPLDYMRHLVLPAIALALPWCGYFPRLVRASMLEVMGSNYIRTARAYGVRERLIFYRFALKNALLPVVAYIGLMLGYGLAGTVYVEVIFSRQGLGSLAYGAISTSDWTLIRAIAVVYAAAFVVGNLLSDLSYRLLDPRIQVTAGVEVRA